MGLKKLSVIPIIVLFIILVACGQGIRLPQSTEEVDAFIENSSSIGDIEIDAAAVVSDTAVDVYKQPETRAERLTQTIYNQPVRVLEEKNGWTYIELSDGLTGWMRSKFLDRNISSIYGQSYTQRLIVTSKMKSVFSHPTAGVTLKELPMGTELYAFNTSGNAFEVYLPGKATGWVRGSGMIQLQPGEDIPKTSGNDFAASALKFKGTSYLQNGVSSLGIDNVGLICSCARINGIEIPRELTKQLEVGESVSLEDLKAGDLVFISISGSKKDIEDAGIYMGNGEYIHASRTSGYVRLDGLNESGADGKPVLARRIFS